MWILLALTPALACDPALSDTVEIRPATGSTDVPTDIRVFVRLGDVQVDDPQLDVVLRNANGGQIDVDLDQDSSSEGLSAVFDWRLTPTVPLPAGEYSLTVVAPDTREEPVVSTFVVGSSRATPPPQPAVELVDVESIDEEDPCFGRHRVVTATLEPRDDADLASLVHVFLHDEGEPPSGAERSDTVLVSPGGRMTLKFNARLPDDDATPSCVSIFVEGPSGDLSALSEPACGAPATDPEPEAEEVGCRCDSAPGAGWWLALPMLALVRRRL